MQQKYVLQYLHETSVRTFSSTSKQRLSVAIITRLQYKCTTVYISVIFVNENENENEKDQQFVHENEN